ncbi:MAG: peptide deformylase [Candidatus Peribacteraceae bacterium]|jgi:peptide deformylase|nr:peptide deformylase [Candidatus Peribacteraceae bacterium]
MTVLPIVKGQDTAVLRKKAEKIPSVTKDIKKLIKNMQQTVKKAEGLGLAAPQVDQSIRLCLASINGRMTPLINPEITWRSEQTSVMDEGCLSLPGDNVDVTRAVEIVISYLSEKGQDEERRLHDLDARVVQHEIDHLDGVLIVDYK